MEDVVVSKASMANMLENGSSTQRDDDFVGRIEVLLLRVAAEVGDMVVWPPPSIMYSTSYDREIVRVYVRKAENCKRNEEAKNGIHH